MITLYYRILSWIWRLRNGSIGKRNVKRIGKLQPLEAITFKIGHKVLTIEGIGIITNIDIDELDETPRYITAVKGGTMHLRIKAIDLLQFFVYHYDLNIYIPLSFSDYGKINHNNKNIEYRITKRGFAKLIKKT